MDRLLPPLITLWIAILLFFTVYFIIAGTKRPEVAKSHLPFLEKYKDLSVRMICLTVTFVVFAVSAFITVLIVTLRSSGG